MNKIIEGLFFVLAFFGILAVLIFGGAALEVNKGYQKANQEFEDIISSGIESLELDYIYYKEGEDELQE